MTETVSEQKIIVPATPVSSGERIAERKIVVFETRVDPVVVKVAAEKLKGQLFSRFWFLNSSVEHIQFVSVDKYYEAFMVINGRYFIDYYRKCSYNVKVDKEAKEVVLHGHNFNPVPHMGDYGVMKLEGEERLKKEFKASIVVDRYGRDVALERLPSAVSERNPTKILETFGVQEVAQDADLNCIRLRIAKRPADVNRLVSEVFEVSDRAVIYAPRFRVRFKNVRTGEERAMVFDGVTTQRTDQVEYEKSPPVPSAPPIVLPPPAEVSTH